MGLLILPSSIYLHPPLKYISVPAKLKVLLFEIPSKKKKKQALQPPDYSTSCLSKQHVCAAATRIPLSSSWHTFITASPDYSHLPPSLMSSEPHNASANKTASVQHHTTSGHYFVAQSLVCCTLPWSGAQVCFPRSLLRQKDPFWAHVVAVSLCCHLLQQNRN